MKDFKMKAVIVSPKWNIIYEDVKDLCKDFVAAASAIGLLMAAEYLSKLDLVALVGAENAPLVGSITALLAAMLSRFARKLQKETHYPQ